MGNGLIPGPADELGRAIAIDEGTLARHESPPPGPIGLDAKGGTAKGGGGSMAEQILSLPRRRRGERVGDGECFTLADRALRGAGARSAADYGSVTPDADYVWGTSIAVSQLQPGDIIQFRGYRYDREVVTEGSDGTIDTAEDYQERPHHTAIVESVGANGAVTVLEQNAPEGSPVTRNQLFLTGGTTTSGRTRTTITVQGNVWCYRPQAR